MSKESPQGFGRKLSLFQAVAMAIGKHMERYPEATE